MVRSKLEDQARAQEIVDHMNSVGISCRLVPAEESQLKSEKARQQMKDEAEAERLIHQLKKARAAKEDAAKEIKL